MNRFLGVAGRPARNSTGRAQDRSELVRLDIGLLASKPPPAAEAGAEHYRKLCPILRPILRPGRVCAAAFWRGVTTIIALATDLSYWTVPGLPGKLLELSLQFVAGDA
jgi:hypothetical protein